MLGFTSACIVYKYKIGDCVKIGKYRDGSEPTLVYGTIAQLTNLREEPAYFVNGVKIYETTIERKMC